MRRPVADLAASVAARLLGLARQGADEYQSLLVRYARERLLYRLSRSEWRERFVLKGASLFAVWSGAPHRSTRDIDLLGFVPPDPARLGGVFRSFCSVEVEPDGLVFVPESVRARTIREADEYQGIRVSVLATLKRTRIPVQVDVGIGDSVVPPPEEVVYPVLLDMSAPRLRAYSRYTVVAEKFETMVELAMANSRLRDYYDVWALARGFEFDGDTLRAALEATFGRRRVELPLTAPVGLTDGFAADAAKQAQWRAFVGRSLRGEGTPGLGEVVAAVRGFVEPVLTGKAQGCMWRPGPGWEAGK